MSKNTGSNKYKDDMVPQRWRYLKELRGPSWRFVHVSKFAKMVLNPLVGTDVPLIPWVEKDGVTFTNGCEPRLPKDFTIPKMASLPSCVSYGIRR